MSGFFVVGERKARPGVYKRYINAGATEISGASDGVCCCIVTGNWGDLNVPVAVDSSVDIASVIGSGKGADVIQEVINGGAKNLIVCRIGSGGTSGAITLQDDAGTSVVTMTAKYPGDREFSITVKEMLDDETQKQATLYDGTTQLEKVTFAAGVDEPDAIVEAFSDSDYIVAKKLDDGSGILADVSQSKFTAGSNPDVDTDAYSNGFSAVEAETWDMLCVDTNDYAVHVLLNAYISRIYEEGAYPRATVAEGSDVNLDDRMAHAASYNSELMHYVLNSANCSDGTCLEGYLAAARVAGMICSTSCSESLTHATITNATELKERLTNAQIEKALSSGCLVFTVSKSKTIWIEKAINTLVTLADNQDKGWKKIRRCAERLELMNRIELTLETMIGKVDNDSDGRAAVIAAAQRVVDAMIGEKKLLSGTVSEDDSNPAEGDSAWFVVAVDDLDSLENVYLTFKFRYSSDGQ